MSKNSKKNLEKKLNDNIQFQHIDTTGKYKYYVLNIYFYCFLCFYNVGKLGGAASQKENSGHSSSKTLSLENLYFPSNSLD